MHTVRADGAVAFAVLGDPVRHRLYRLTTERAVGRDEAADLLGIPRSTVAFHLDRLADAGLVEVEFQRLSGRTGPGAGRPAKLYRAVAAELVASIPERRYELAGDLLAGAVERAEREDVPVREALSREAFAAGCALGASRDGLEAALEACGYEPRTDDDGDIALANCPFHTLASRHTPLICGANLELVRGLSAATGDVRAAELVAPGAGCCVAVRRTPAPPTE